MGETVGELRRVTWPSRQETMRLTIMVLAVAASVGLFLYAFDLAFASIFDVLLGN
jgi:preprotein translocase subunit SecE